MGAQPQSGARVEGAVSCSYGYGVELVHFSGAVSAGYINTMAQPLVAEVNGRPAAVMDAQLTGPSAKRLLQVLPGSAAERTSPGGRIRCQQLSDGNAVCIIKGMVGFWTPGEPQTASASERC